MIAKLKINILYCLGLVLKTLILILIYHNSNMYNKKIPASTPFIYKGFDAGIYRIKKVFLSLIRFLKRGESPNQLQALQSRSGHRL